MGSVWKKHPLFGLSFRQREGILTLCETEKNRLKGGNCSMKTPRQQETTLWSNLILETGLTTRRERSAGCCCVCLKGWFNRRQETEISWEPAGKPVLPSLQGSGCPSAVGSAPVHSRTVAESAAEHHPDTFCSDIPEDAERQSAWRS